MMNYEKNHHQNTLSLSLFWLFLMGGLGDAMSKVFEYYGIMLANCVAIKMRCFHWNMYFTVMP